MLRLAWTLRRGAVVVAIATGCLLALVFAFTGSEASADSDPHIPVTTALASQWIKPDLLDASVPAPAPEAPTRTNYLPIIATINEIRVTTTTDELTVDGACSLREAIQAANLQQPVDKCGRGAPGMNLIEIPAGIYVLTRVGAHEDANLSGDLDLSGTMTLLSQGTVIVDGSGTDRVFDVLTGTLASLRGIAIRNGSAPSGAALIPGGCGVAGEDGGGVRNYGILDLIQSQVSGNRAGDGGAVIALECETAFVDGGRGGGIANFGDLKIAGGAVLTNYAGAGGSWSRPGASIPGSVNGGCGGGILNAGTLDLVEATVAGNAAGGGGLGLSGPGYIGGTGGDGGALCATGSTVIERSTLSGNAAGDGAGAGGTHAHGGNGGQGGAIFNATAGALQMINSTISSNHSGAGGGSAYGGTGGDGGGIANSGQVRLDSTTIATNTTGAGGESLIGDNGPAGLGGGIVAGPTAPTVRNLILAANSATDGPDCLGTLASAGYNLVSNAKDCTLSNDLTGNLIGVDANLMALGNYGGPTWTHNLGAASPARNAGSCTDSLGNALKVDQRLVVRPQGVQCDMGAVEATP